MCAAQQQLQSNAMIEGYIPTYLVQVKVAEAFQMKLNRAETIRLPAG